jgi:hypothetical protein
MDKKNLTDQSTKRRREGGPLRRLTRSEQIIAALIGLVGAVLAAILPITLSSSGVQTGKSDSATPRPPSPIATSSLPPEAVVQDDTGDISLLVPQNWDSIYANGWHTTGLPPFANGTNIGPGLNATTNASSWSRDLTTPGIFVGASRRLVAAHYTPNKVLQQIALDGCTSSPSQGYATADWTGAQEIWSCTHSATHWWTVAMWPHDHSYIVDVQIKIVTSRDQLIGQHALDSLSVKF